MKGRNDDVEKLLADYRELQLRVTRFSAVEQELINTRDQLDAELVLYKRLNDFIKDAFKRWILMCARNVGTSEKFR